MRYLSAGFTGLRIFKDSRHFLKPGIMKNNTFQFCLHAAKYCTYVLPLLAGCWRILWLKFLHIFCFLPLFFTPKTWVPKGAHSKPLAYQDTTSSFVFTGCILLAWWFSAWKVLRTAWMMGALWDSTAHVTSRVVRRLHEHCFFGWPLPHVLPGRTRVRTLAFLLELLSHAVHKCRIPRGHFLVGDATHLGVLRILDFVLPHQFLNFWITALEGHPPW